MILATSTTLYSFIYQLSGLSQKFLDVCVVSVEFASCSGLRELPVHGFVVPIAVGGPGEHFLAQDILLRDTPVQALRRQRCEFNFCHIEPRSFERRVVRLKPLAECERCVRS